MPLINPVFQFLIDANPEVIDGLRTGTVGDGAEFTEGAIDTVMLRRLITEHYAKGQKHLEGFRKWLVREQGDNEKAASKVAAHVWNTLCITYNRATEKSEPTRILDPSDSTYTYSGKNAIRGALKQWARYTHDNELYDKLLLDSTNRTKEEPDYVLKAMNQHAPYSDAEFRRLRKALEEFKGSPRVPWGYPLMRILLIYGIPLAQLKGITKKEIVFALTKETLTLRKLKHVKTLLVEPIREPLEILAGFGWDWGTIGQLINPSGKVYHTQFTTFARKVYERAKVTFDGGFWQYRLKMTAAWNYYRKTKSLVGTAQILNTEKLDRVHNLLKVMRRLEARELATAAVTIAERILEEGEATESADAEVTDAEDGDEGI